MKFISKNTIKLDKEINELDKFVLRFIKILEKHVNYVIVSGYVSILLGRDRSTDDIDIIIPKTDKNGLRLLYDNLVKNGYWCLNSSDLGDIYEILTYKHNIRFALEPSVSPNIRLRISRDLYEDIALKHPIKVNIRSQELNVSLLGLKFDSEEIRKLNNEDRMWFVEYWAEYVRTHPDKEWSKQQNILIKSMMKNAKNSKLSPKEYLEIKGEL